MFYVIWVDRAFKIVAGKILKQVEQQANKLNYEPVLCSEA